MSDTYKDRGIGKRSLYKVAGAPLKGGAVTSTHKGLLEPGMFSVCQNVRSDHPGFKKRKGYQAQHTVADGSNRVESIYHYNRENAGEEYLLAQMSDGDILSATTMPPGSTTGAFGSEVYSGNPSPNPASWSKLTDTLIMSNGVDQHQIWTGETEPVSAFAVHKAASADLTTIVGVIGNADDYTLEVQDSDASTVAILDSMNTKANGDGFLVMTPIPAKSITVTMQNTNTSNTTLSGYYWKNDHTWAALSGFTDGTNTGTKTLNQSGTISWTQPTDIQDKLQLGKVGYWYLFVSNTVALDSSVTISHVTYDSDFAPLKILWDGAPVNAAEVQIEGTAPQYERYAASAVSVGSLGANKLWMIACPDPVEGFYIDTFQIPNASGTTLNDVEYWNGSAWTSVGTVNDATGGLQHPAWITFPRQSDVSPRSFQSNEIYAYWYRLSWDSALTADMTVGITLMPYYDIADFGNIGQSSSSWKNRVVYSFTDKFPEYVYISGNGAPQILTAPDTGIIELGDGRAHKVAAMRPYNNELMVWQEEHGAIGGTLTLIQGYNSATFGKVVLSTRLGTMNNQSVDIIEDFKYRTATYETIKKAAFCLSREGIYMCEGNRLSYIDHDIHNYFFPDDPECIRRGYEHKMWLKYDMAERVIRVGLVSGNSATDCNVWPVFDLQNNVWYFDDLANPMACFENVGAATGDLPVVQVSGGTADGTVYNQNTGLNDISTPIDAIIDVEFHNGGEWILLEWLSLMYETQAAGAITLTTYQNSLLKDTVSIDMTSDFSTRIIRRWLQSLNVHSPLITVRFRHNTADETWGLQHLGVEIYAWDRR